MEHTLIEAYYFSVGFSAIFNIRKKRLSKSENIHRHQMIAFLQRYLNMQPRSKLIAKNENTNVKR